MTLLELLEKSKKEYGSTGIPYLLETWIINYDIDEILYKICGFLWACEMLGYITEEDHRAIERDMLNN